MVPVVAKLVLVVKQADNCKLLRVVGRRGETSEAVARLGVKEVATTGANDRQGRAAIDTGNWQTKIPIPREEVDEEDQFPVLRQTSSARGRNILAMITGRQEEVLLERPTIRTISRSFAYRRPTCITKLHRMAS